MILLKKDRTEAREYGKSAEIYFLRLRVRLALMKECTVKYKQTTVKIPSIVAR